MSNARGVAFIPRMSLFICTSLTFFPLPSSDSFLTTFIDTGSRFATMSSRPACGFSFRRRGRCGLGTAVSNGTFASSSSLESLMAVACSCLSSLH